MNRRELFPAVAIGGASALLTGAGLGALAVSARCAPMPAPATEGASAALATAIERHRAALAAQEAAGRVHGAREAATIERPDDTAARAAFEAADDAFNASCSREQGAHNAVIAVPILTLADMRAKAAYLASVARHMIHDGATMAALLASMGGEAELSDLTTEPDPLAALVADYRRGLADFNAGDGETTEEFTADEARTFGPYYARLSTTPPPATTLAGALAAIRLVADEEETCGSQPELTINTLRAALVYFDGRA